MDLKLEGLDSIIRSPIPASPESTEKLVGEISIKMTYRLNQQLMGKDLLPNTNDLGYMELKNKMVDAMDIDWSSLHEEEGD